MYKISLPTILERENYPFPVLKEQVSLLKSSSDSLISPKDTLNYKPDFKPKSSVQTSIYQDVDTLSVQHLRTNITLREHYLNPNAELPIQPYKTYAQRNLQTSELTLFKPSYYKPDFYLNSFKFDIDNSYLSPFYQPYVAGTSLSLIPSLGAFFKLNVLERFNHQSLTLAARYPSSFKESEYFVSYKHTLNRSNWEVLFHRNVNKTNGVKLVTHNLFVKLQRPLTTTWSYKAHLNLREDRSIFQALDTTSLLQDSKRTLWASGLFEVTYYNFRSIGNYSKGIKGKFFMDYFHNLTEGSNYTASLGFDWRWYTPIYLKDYERAFNLCIRAGFSHSLGRQKTIYYLGGSQNELSSRFNTTNSVADPNTYTFQALATNMRGFIQNSRNGTSFFVINTEVRLPVSSLLESVPQSNFWRSASFVPFIDMGSAWVGLSPFSDQTTSNSKIITSGPVKVIVKNFNSPILMSSGMGFRFKFWGYDFNLDWAKGFNKGKFQTALWHLSLGGSF